MLEANIVPFLLVSWRKDTAMDSSDAAEEMLAFIYALLED